MAGPMQNLEQLFHFSDDSESADDGGSREAPGSSAISRNSADSADAPNVDAASADAPKESSPQAQRPGVTPATLRRLHRKQQEEQGGATGSPLRTPGSAAKRNKKKRSSVKRTPGAGGIISSPSPRTPGSTSSKGSASRLHQFPREDTHLPAAERIKARDDEIARLQDMLGTAEELMTSKDADWSAKIEDLNDMLTVVEEEFRSQTTKLQEVNSELAESLEEATEERNRMQKKLRTVEKELDQWHKVAETMSPAERQRFKVSALYASKVTGGMPTPTKARARPKSASMPRVDPKAAPEAAPEPTKPVTDESLKETLRKKKEREKERQKLQEEIEELKKALDGSRGECESARKECKLLRERVSALESDLASANAGVDRSSATKSKESPGGSGDHFVMERVRELERQLEEEHTQVEFYMRKLRAVQSESMAASTCEDDGDAAESEATDGDAAPAPAVPESERVQQLQRDLAHTREELVAAREQVSQEHEQVLVLMRKVKQYDAQAALAPPPESQQQIRELQYQLDEAMKRIESLEHQLQFTERRATEAEEELQKANEHIQELEESAASTEQEQEAEGEAAPEERGEDAAPPGDDEYELSHRRHLVALIEERSRLSEKITTLEMDLLDAREQLSIMQRRAGVPLGSEASPAPARSAREERLRALLQDARGELRALLQVLIDFHA